MIASECESLEGQSSRITSELAALALDPQLTYRISHRHQRTLLFVQVAPVQPQKIDHPPRLRISGYGSDLQQKGNSGRHELVQNSFNFEESKDRLQYNLDENPMQERVGQVEPEDDQMQKKLVIFTIILHHQLYPYEAPYIMASTGDHWPRVDDGRNYFYDIMHTDCWWPLLALSDIVQQLPAFAYKYYCDNEQQPPCFGQFQFQMPLYRQDLMQVSPHFFPSKLMLKQGKGPLGSYQDAWAYFTYSGIVLLDEQEVNKFYVSDTIAVEELTFIHGGQHKGCYKLALQTKDGLSYKLKWLAEQIQNQMMSRILLFQFYYQALVEINREGQWCDKAIKLIDICNNIIVEADYLQLRQAVKWAKGRILLAATHLE